MSRSRPNELPDTPRSGGDASVAGDVDHEKTFGELLVECDVYPNEKSMFVNYDRVSRMFSSSDEAATVVSTLHDEIVKVNDFTEQIVEALEAETERMVELVPEGTRLGQVGVQQSQNQTTGSAVWRWFTSKVKGQPSSVTTGDVQRCYLACHEHMRYLRMNAEAVSRLSRKIVERYSGQELVGVPDDASLPFLKSEHRFHKILSDLETIYPVEDLPQLRLHGEGQAQPVDEKSVMSTVMGKSVLYYSIVIALAAPICFWAYTQETHRARCLCMLCLMLLLNLSQAVPLYCTALSVPFFSMLFRVFPEDDLVLVTKQLLSVMFSPVVFVILVMLTINTIMIKCQIELRFANFLTRSSVSMHSPMFLLLLMVGTMFMAGFCQSGFLMMGALVPRLRDLPERRRSTARSILLGIMMSANIGGALLPLSSVQSLIAISALREFHTDISMVSWVIFSVPVSVCVLLGTWVIILFIIGLPARGDDSGAPHLLSSLAESHIYKVSPFSWTQLFFLALSVTLVVSLVFTQWIDHYLGGIVIVAFLFLFICYGSGFCSTTDFNNLNWDVVMCIAGSNALNHAMRMSGLATWLSSQLLTQQDIVKDYIWWNSVKITGFVMIMASFFGQSCAAIIFLPFVMPLAISLYAPETVALMCVVGITCSFAFPFSTQDNYIISASSRDDFRRRYLTFTDVVKVGLPGSILSFILVVTLGYFIAISHFGLPPKHILKSTPDTLRPSVKAWNEGQALEARLQAIENRYRSLEKRSGISVRLKDEGKEDSDSFLSMRNYQKIDKLVMTGPSRRPTAARKNLVEKELQKTSAVVSSSHVLNQVKNQTKVHVEDHSPKEKGKVPVPVHSHFIKSQ